MAGGVRADESHWPQDVRLPLEMSTRSTRRSGEAARRMQEGDTVALPEESPSGATQLWSFCGSLGADAYAARRSRSWEGSCAQNPIPEEPLDPGAALLGNPQSGPSRSLDGHYGHGMPPVSPWISHDSGARPSSRTAAYQSEAKRSGVPHVCCMCYRTYQTMYSVWIIRNGMQAFRHNAGSYLLTPWSDNHAPHTHAGQLRVQWRACSNGRPLSN